MEFHEKLQELRKQKGITQEELAASLFVSRTAVSKWESGRGYPSIDSLKSIAGFFGVTIDDLLSGDEVLTIAETDSRERERSLRDRVFGLLDCSAAAFLILPFFSQRTDSGILEVSLPALTDIAPYMKAAYLSAVLLIVASGVLHLAMQEGRCAFWDRHRTALSLLLNVTGVFLFILSPQPYAASFLFIFLVIKGLMLIKKQ